MRRFFAGLAVSLLAALLVAVPVAPASAIDVPPPPIQEVLDIPSRVVKSVTGTPLGDAVMMMLRGQTWVAAGGSLNTIPKPITAPQVLVRGAGAPLTAGMLGWGIGSNGALIALGAIQGTSYDQQFCAQDDWYQAVTGFINFGVKPDCKQFAPQPNADQAVVWTLTYAGATMTIVGAPFASGSPQLYNYCGKRSGAAYPSNLNFRLQTESGGGTAHPYNAFSGGQLEYWRTNCSTAGLSAADATGGYPNLPAFATGLQVWDTNALPGMQLKAQATGTTSNPLRTPKCYVKLGNEVFTALGFPYRETEGIPTSSAGLGCEQAYEDFVSAPGRGPELVPDEITVESIPEGGGAPTEISRQVTPEYTPAEKTALAPTSSKRGLVLEKVVNGVTDSCMTWAADCANWWSQTSSGTQTTTSTGTYRCLFADQLIDLAECGIYRYTFDTKTATPTVTDPLTGTQTPWTSGSAAGSTSGNNSTGPGSFPSPGDACFAQGWPSLANPVDWVLHPVKCALVAAFVPRVTVVEGTITGLGEAAGDVAAVDPLMALVDMLPAGGGCGGIPVSLTFFGQTATGNLLSACDGFGATAAAVVNGLLTLSVTTAALFAVTRYAAAVFGFVGPGGSFQQQEYSNAMMARSAARSD